jgi:2-hydroxy-3-keto-5-methylthiopentenyl-1-phosphate phosphatase
MTLSCPFASDSCDVAAAHCKCASIAQIGQPGRRSIYIGDGRSDLCPARKADLVFAKGALAAALAKEGRKFIRFASLLDVAQVFLDEWDRRDL